MQYSKNIHLDLISESKDSFEPIHPRLEITLLVNAFSRYPVPGVSPRSGTFRTFLANYFQQHHRLPNGHYRILDDSDKPLGSIDIGKIRAKVRTLQRQKNSHNINRLQSSSDGLMLQLEWEMRIGLSLQATGNSANDSVNRIREQEIRNLDRFSTHTYKSHE